MEPLTIFLTQARGEIDAILSKTAPYPNLNRSIFRSELQPDSPSTVHGAYSRRAGLMRSTLASVSAVPTSPRSLAHAVFRWKCRKLDDCRTTSGNLSGRAALPLALPSFSPEPCQLCQPDLNSNLMRGLPSTALNPRHCERSEAIQSVMRGALDCFATLAMTSWEQRETSYISLGVHPGTRAG